MAMASSQQIIPEAVTSPWYGFKTGLWQKEINCRGPHHQLAKHA